MRRAVAQDAATIADIMVHTLETAYRRIVPNDFLDHLGDTIETRRARWRAIASRPDPDATFVASVGQLAGYASGWPGGSCKFSQQCVRPGT